MKDGFFLFNGFNTYYQIFGDEKDQKPPLLILNGGPGSSRHYLLNLQKLTKTGRKVILYDQLGSGSSEGRDETKLWNIKTFVDQVEAVRSELNLKEIHLLGHSWGGMLAIEYMMTEPSGVLSLTLASSMISMPLYQKEVDNLVADLPENTRLTLEKHHKAGTIDNPEYKQALQEYENRHIFTGEHWPSELSTPKGAFNPAIYQLMWGLDETYAHTGSLKNWDRINDLHKITIPTLITSGRYDELTPHQSDITHKEIANSQQVIFEHSSHCHHIEEEARFLETLSAFMADAENK